MLFFKRRLTKGGDGSSIDSAIIVDTSDHMEGIKAEHAYLTSKHGKRDSDWRLVMQRLDGKGEKHYDVIAIRLKNGEEKTIYFDITRFYGK